MNRRSLFGLSVGAAAAAALSIVGKPASAATRRFKAVSCVWPAVWPEDAKNFVARIYAGHEIYDPRQPSGGGLLGQAEAMTDAEWDRIGSETAQKP